MLFAVLTGIAGGTVLAVLLFRIARAVCSGGKLPVISLIAFMLVPLAVLLAVAFTVPERLVVSATVMVAVLLLGSAVKLIRDRIKKKRETQ